MKFKITNIYFCTRILLQEGGQCLTRQSVTLATCPRLVIMALGQWKVIGPLLCTLMASN